MRVSMLTEATNTRQVSSMIHSARPTISPVANIVFALTLFCFEKWGRTDGRTDDMCKNNDHYQQRLWVSLVDQKYACLIEFSSEINTYTNLDQSYQNKNLSCLRYRGWYLIFQLYSWKKHFKGKIVWQSKLPYNHNEVQIVQLLENFSAQYQC